MKVAVICDTHIGARNDSEVFSDYFFKFIEEVFLPYLEVHEIYTVLHLGDLLDRRKYVNFKTLARLRNQFVKPLQEMGVTTHLILGNHDVFFKNTSELNSVSELFAECSNLHVYANPIELDLDGLKIGMVPWINRENQDTSLKFLETTKAEIMMGHFEIQGFQVIRGVRQETGLDRALLSRFEAVYSGHFHHRQESGNITYLGCPYQITFSDLGESKGFHVLDTVTREMEFVENPYKMFHKLVYDDVENDYDTTEDKSAYKNSYLKIIVIQKTKPYIFDRFLDSFYDAGVASIQIVEDVDADTSAEESINVEMDTMALINNEIDSMTNLENPSKLKSIIQMLYIEALDQ